VAVASELAKQIVVKQLAACVNTIPGIQSVCPWQGKLETAQEILLMVKTWYWWLVGTNTNMNLRNSNSITPLSLSLGLILLTKTLLVLASTSLTFRFRFKLKFRWHPTWICLVLF
jgi:hypothetical protein